MKLIFRLFLLISSMFAHSQNLNFSSHTIQKELLDNANSIIKSQIYEINIVSRTQMTIKKSKTITIFNSKGLNNIDAIEYFDKSTKIKNIDAIIYDDNGKEIKKIKKKDFVDQSIADGFSVYRDDRLLALDYTPSSYPFTVQFNSEIETVNTAIIPKWSPIDDYYESVVYSSIQINYPVNLGFKYKEINFGSSNITKKETPNSITYTAENLKAVKRESYALSFLKLNPIVLFGVDLFSLEGVEGTASSWSEFGKWMYQNLLKETEELPDATKTIIKELVGQEKDPIKKARLIYKFVQDRSRYVSVQLGIGGWKPMTVSDVDRLGYGDCKALSNYTRVLLKEVGVESYYTIIYAGDEKQNINEDFVSVQGNHAILALPINNDYVFIECTSQTSPFGFNGDFTDDRFALIVKPDGGEIIKTNNYNAEKSTQTITGNLQIDETGSVFAQLKLVSTGIQYENSRGIETKSANEKDIYYKEHFSWFSDINFNSIQLINDKEKIEFIENLSFTANNYTNQSGELILLPINAFNRNLNTPQRYKNRENAFEISRGFNDIDVVEITLSREYEIDSKPNDYLIESKFGKYAFKIDTSEPNKIKYKRNYLLNTGLYAKEDYEEWRKFNEQITKADLSKILLKKTKQ